MTFARAAVVISWDVVIPNVEQSIPCGEIGFARDDRH
jgi:hypothetical protein